MRSQGDRIIIDFETYWSQKERYSVSSLTAVEYILDPRFQVVCVAAKLNDEPVRSWTGHQLEDFETWLSGVRTENATIICHNGIFFDFLILGWLFNLRPARWADTLLMARSLVPRGVKADLGSLAKWLGFPPKGDEVMRTDGMRLNDFTDEDMRRYRVYCERDVEICSLVADRLMPCWLERDLQWMHLCCSMGAEPQFQLDRGILVAGIEEEKERHRNIYMTLAEGLVERGIKLPAAAWGGKGPKHARVYAPLEEAIKKAVGSVPMCATLLSELGEYVPMKYSEKQDARVPALARSDVAFMQLADSDDETVRALVEARLASKSSIRMSRLLRLITTADLTGGTMPIFLEPFATVTGRNAGKQRVNIQNFSSRKSKSNPEGKANPLRRAMRAPPGYAVYDVDSSQIEVRVLGALTGETAIIGPFLRGEDVYCTFGTQLYGYEVTKDASTKYERTVSKAAVLGNGYGQGAFGFQRYAKIYGLDFTFEDAEKIVQDYRRLNPFVVQFWRLCDRAIEAMIAGTPFQWGQNGCLRTEGKSVVLPSGRRIFYHELQWRDQINPLTNAVVGREAVYYDPRKRDWRKLYGSLMTENICQATAADVINTQAVWLYSRYGYKPAAQVHDALVYVVTNQVAKSFLTAITACMSETPDWLPFVPLECEAECGPSYGEMKVVNVEDL